MMEYIGNTHVYIRGTMPCALQVCSCNVALYYMYTLVVVIQYI